MNYIDLGLSVKWTDCNIDANNPDEYGTYFNFDESLNINNIPTKEQWEELQKNCKFSFDKKRNGIIATGTNGNSIFLPFACEENGRYDEALGEFFFTVLMQNVKTILIKNINTNKLERFDFDYVCPRLVNEIDYGVDLTGMVSRNNSWYNCAIQVKFWNPFTDNMITNTIVSGVDSDACRNHFINPEDNYNIFICWLGTDKNVSRYLKANKLLYKHLVFIDMDVLNINVNNKLPQFWIILNDNIKSIKNIILNA